MIPILVLVLDCLSDILGVFDLLNHFCVNFMLNLYLNNPSQIRLCQTSDLHMRKWWIEILNVSKNKTVKCKFQQLCMRFLSMSGSVPLSSVSLSAILLAIFIPARAKLAHCHLLLLVFAIVTIHLLNGFLVVLSIFESKWGLAAHVSLIMTFFLLFLGQVILLASKVLTHVRWLLVGDSVLGQDLLVALVCLNALRLSMGWCHSLHFHRIVWADPVIWIIYRVILLLHSKLGGIFVGQSQIHLVASHVIAWAIVGSGLGPMLPHGWWSQSDLSSWLLLYIAEVVCIDEQAGLLCLLLKYAKWWIAWLTSLMRRFLSKWLSLTCCAHLWDLLRSCHLA